MFNFGVFLIELTNELIGKDEFGNEYFQSREITNLGRKRRYVVYKGLSETSKIPPMWHAWLHYLTDEKPNIKTYSWQKNHMPNLTGTAYAYKPNKNSSVKTKTYTSWNNNN